ncbi:MAG: diguanylate cyclase [Oscillospiraceae bacterium]|nr:diguanylate cyclase [Oscillospiraceae bacterium]
MYYKKNKSRTFAVIAIIVFSIIVLGVTVFMTIRNTRDMQAILEESIKTQLISTSLAARSLLDVDAFYSYNSKQDIIDDYENFSAVMANLRSLKDIVGATYIYALKYIDGTYFFVFDTDEESDTIFDEYEIYHVHERAFLGYEAAGIMNVVDEYGSFNTGAVPIFRDGQIIGIISTDIEDTFIQESIAASTHNIIVLVALLVVAMGVMIVIVVRMMGNVRKAEEKLFKMANYDILTGLPNRQYLMHYLEDLSSKSLKAGEPFAFLLIDMDNFKKVNDGAGHDAGDELLRHFAEYLSGLHEQSKEFRPPAGRLNVSARIGGDEFVQIIPGIKSEQEAQEFASNMIANFASEDIDRFVERYKVGISVGVALFPQHTKDYNVLIKYADMAMYHAKKNGKNTYCVYNEDLFRTEIEMLQEAGAGDRRQFRGNR